MATAGQIKDQSRKNTAEPQELSVGSVRHQEPTARHPIRSMPDSGPASGAYPTDPSRAGTMVDYPTTVVYCSSNLPQVARIRRGWQAHPGR